MSDGVREDSIAEELEDTRWDYSQRKDRRFLLEPIGEIFKSFCWDGQQDRAATLRRESERKDDPE